MKIIHVVGARPNFIKMAPIQKQMDLFPDCFEQIVVHTGQHYDENMSKVFFSELSLPEPDYNLNIGSGSHAWQIANVILKFEELVLQFKPALVLVVGDVNATIACAMVCSKLGIMVAHVEAGLRSRDWSMPEEINRLLTDQISDLLFMPSHGNANLAKEGVEAGKVFLVGNVMIDSLTSYMHLATKRADILLDTFGLNDYGLITLHRPSNVDDLGQLKGLTMELIRLSDSLPLVFPIHPRTKAKLLQFGLLDILNQGEITLLDPLGYIDFVALQSRANFILTDSGGVQEESTFLGVPCLTLRDNTERPVTISHGTNVILGKEANGLLTRVDAALKSIYRRRVITPPLGDGRASERIVDIISQAIAG
jgi:UDP-N-acetylglucosamine 2-epimerase (non-hydrolysing)